MNAKEHQIAGICAGVATCLLIEKTNLIQSVYEMDTMYRLGSYAAIIGVSSLGALVPDIDQPNSTVGRKLKLLSVSLNKVFGHRGLLHYPLFLLLIIGILHFLYPYVNTQYQYIYKILSIGFSAGYISHIILDMFNSKGIKLLGPFIGFDFKIPIGITFKKKNKFISWRYLKGDSVVDKCIANFISMSSIILLALYLYGYLKF